MEKGLILKHRIQCTLTICNNNKHQSKFVNIFNIKCAGGGSSNTKGSFKRLRLLYLISEELSRQFRRCSEFL